MASKKDRIFAGFGAMLFLVTSSALTIIVIVSLVQQNKQSKSTSNTSTTTTKKGSTMLQGTKLSNFTPLTSIPQLQEQDLVEGTGDAVKAGATVTVDYTGAVASTGIIFQSSKDSGQPATLSLAHVIPGWIQGIPGMKVGGTRRLLIPSALAYGASPPSGSGIPANADLVFDVTLHSISK